MAEDRSAELMQALIAKLYATITGNAGGEIKMPRNKYVTWLLPGWSFKKRDFKYCSKGLIGDTAEETRELYHQAFVISKLLDYIPDVNTQFADKTMQQTIFTTTQDTISSVYRDILKYSKVVNLELSDKEKKKLQKFRDLLTVTKEIEDIITEEKRTITEDGPLKLAYDSKMEDWINAADNYTNLLIDAQSAKGKDSEAIRRVAAWANKSKFLRKKMEAAEMAWVSQGYKNEYEQITAYINQVTQKSMVLYKQDLLNKFNSSLLTSPGESTAGDFYYTTLLPGNFATSPGWTKFYFYEKDYETHRKKDTSKRGAKGGVSLFGIMIGGKAGSSKVEIASEQKASTFTAEFEFTQVMICRPFFDPGFFSMRGWTLDDLWYLNFDKKKVSDGKEKPVGRLVAYPVNALFIRNTRFKLDESERVSNYINKQVESGGFAGWGPFVFNPSYSRGSETKDSNFHVEGGEIVIPGMQLIGFINNMVPMCPNTHPDLKPEQFVGGEYEF